MSDEAPVKAPGDIDPTHCVVVHDYVSFRDPADAPTIPREQYHWLFAKYGDHLPAGVSQAELQAGIALGAIVNEDSPQAKRALAGMPPARAAAEPGIKLREGLLPSFEGDDGGEDVEAEKPKRGSGRKASR